MKIATWNVNSLRVRLQQVLDWLQMEQPDVLALQETKVTDEFFPLEALQAAGYEVIFSGQKTYNGLATLSKHPMTAIEKNILPMNPEEKRVLGVTIQGLRIWNIYVPNGESPESPKYPYKLAWLNHLQTFLVGELKTHSQLILLGDFNIAPEAQDVYDPKAWENQVLFSPPERAALQTIFDLKLQDCFRLQAQAEKSYSWWDYRLNAFKRNLGLRIDLILATQSLAERCTQCRIDKTPRSSERPSDHAPVIAEFKL